MGGPFARPAAAVEHRNAQGLSRFCRRCRRGIRRCCLLNIRRRLLVVGGRRRSRAGIDRRRSRCRSRVHRIRRVGVSRVVVLVPAIVPPVSPVVAVVVMVMTVMAVVTVVVMAMTVVMIVMTVMTVMTVTTAVHHVPAATTVAAPTVTTTVAAAVTAGFGTSDGERRQADNNRCGKGEDCSAFEHVSGSLVCSAGIIPGSVLPMSLKTRLAAVSAITLLSNPAAQAVRNRAAGQTQLHKMAWCLRL